MHCLVPVGGLPEPGVCRSREKKAKIDTAIAELETGEALPCRQARAWAGGKSFHRGSPWLSSGAEEGGIMIIHEDTKTMYDSSAPRRVVRRLNRRSRQ